MARTAVTITDLTSNNLTALPGATALDPTNGHAIAGAFGKNDKLLIYVDHTTASTKVLTIKAGVNPPATTQATGDLALSMSATTKYFVGPFEAARFAQADGSINIDVAASTTGNIYAVRVPRTV